MIVTDKKVYISPANAALLKLHIDAREQLRRDMLAAERAEDNKRLREWFFRKHPIRGIAAIPLPRRKPVL